MSDQPHDRPDRTTKFDLAQFESRYREEAERVVRTGEPRIVWVDDDGLVRHIERLYPIVFRKALVPRAPVYWRAREQARVLLHGAVCTFTDDRGEEPRPQGEPHAPDECEAHTWKFLDKRYGELYREWAAAAGLCPELAKHQPWAGTLLVTELERPNRRGRPALKHPWYDLATAFKLTTMKVNQDVPRGIFPALARCLSAPWFGLSFSAKELKTRTREIEADLHTAHGVIRHEYSARIQWGDMLMIAVMYSKLPPAQAARRFPEAWSGRWHAVSARWLAEPT